MADLSRGTRGVNVLVTALDRHRGPADADGRRVQDIDAQVDYRDPQGRTQTNPHLAVTQEAAPSGGRVPRTTSPYSSTEVESIARAAGQRGTFELRDLAGQRVGMLYAVKADLVPVDQRHGAGLRVDARTASRSDFDVDLGTRDAQFQNMLWARGDGMQAAVADRGHDTYLRERQSQALGDRDGSDGISTEEERLQHLTTLSAVERVEGVQPVRLDTVALREARTAEQLRLMPDLDHGQRQAQRAGSYTTQQLAAIREASAASPGKQSPGRGLNSQAGLAAARGPARSVPSSPAPGQPGSRFNPVVRERTPRPQPSPAPGMVTSADVPKAEPSKQEQRAAKKAHRKEEARLDRKMAVEGVKGGAQGAKLGSKAGSVVPGLGTAAGTAIGAGVGASASMSKTAIEAGDSKRAFRAAVPLGGVAGGAVAAKMAANQGAKQPGALQGVTREQAPAKRPTAGERLRDSKVGQAVQSEGFRNGAKRVGTEALRDAAAGAARAKQTGSSSKGVVASAAKGAAVGMARGIRSEMGNRDAADLVGRMGSVVGKGPQEQKGSGQQGRRPVSETYDYQFEGRDQPEGGVEQQRGA